MPKNKKPIESTRTSSRRQASKEALKQMQLLLDDEDDDAFVIPDEEEDRKDIRLEPPPPPPPKKRAISPIMESPTPKKKYKLSHRKSSDGNDRDVIVLKSISNSNYVPKENTLELECFVEELSEVQKERQKKAELEEKELEAKLEELLKSKKAEVVYTGEISSAVEVNELITSCGKKSIFKPTELPQLDEKTPAFHLVMDPRLGLIVGTFSKTTNQVQTTAPTIPKSKLQISAAVKDVATIPQNTITPGRNMRTRKSVSATPSPTIQTRGNNSIPTRANSLGVSTRGNTNTPRSNNSTPTRGVPQVTTTVPSPSIQTRGMKATPTIQTRNNKAAPPTTSKRPAVNVPVEKPSKQVVDLTSEDNRNQADNREISFNKLQGKTYPSLVVVARPQLRVTDLAVDRSKLDSKVKSVLMHPPTKFTEWLIQQGLIRAEQKCPVHSNTQLKLGMYSDVSKFPFSGGYVWISECCPQRFVSVFNGSLFEGSPHPPMVMLKLIYHWSCQTNIQNVTQWVKVDNLYVKGVYTWLRGVCTVAVQSRLRQLGGPGNKVEVGVISLGTTSHDGNQRQVKVEVLGVLETSTKYIRLRAVEPMPDGDRNFRKKFSKILEPILHWVHPASTIITDLTVDKATLHNMGFTNVFQTISSEYNQSNRTIMEYLRRIVPRMFQNTLSLLSRQIIQQFLDELVWREWFGTTSQAAFDNIIVHLAEQTRSNPHTPLVLKLNKVAANPFRSWSNSTQNQVATNSVTPAPVVPSSTTTAPAVAKTPVTEVKKYGRGKKSNSPQVQVAQERPTKPVSPDVPEQMVPLENYYYGTIDPINSAPAKVTLNMKCPFCKSSFDNNILLQNHLFKHAHNVSNDAYLCRYCLTSVSTANELIHHVNKCHPGETKFDYGFVCLICEIHYMNPFVLGKHMSKEHIPHELPYQCGSCSFRCSNHKQVIDHFYLKHDGGSSIQCPFCLKSTTVWSGGRNVAQNIHYFIQHLQKHQKKQFAKRCGKCNLWFVQKEILKEHQQKMHISLRGKVGLVPYPSPRNGVMVPKSKIDKNPCDAEVINFSSLYYNLSNNSVCKECNQAVSSSKHFPSFDNCQNPNCQYSTCCAIAMMTHNAKCKGLNSVIPPETLPFEMFCVCGFREVDGNSMAKHLAVCEKKSAYPSEAEAKSATVMHSMLDILGLVRKPEESKSEKPLDSSDGQEKNEGVEDSSKISNNETDPNEISVLSDEEMEITDLDKVNENSVKIDSKNNASEKEVPEYKKEEQIKPTDPEEISDKNNENSDDKRDEEISHSKNNDIIDLDEEDAIMVEEGSDESPQCQPNESNHPSTEQNEQESENPMSEFGNTNSSTGDKQVNSHINEEDSTADKRERDIEMEDDQNEIKKHLAEDHTDENIEIEHRSEMENNHDGSETNQTEKCIKTDYRITDIKADHTEKEILTDHTEKEEVKSDPTGKEELEAEHTKEKDTESDNTAKDDREDKIEKYEIEAQNTEKEEVEADCSEGSTEADPNEKEDIDADHTEKENIEEDHTEKENIEVDHTEKENIEADHTEMDDIQSDHTEKVDIEAVHTQNEKIEEGHTKMDEIESDHTEKANIEADHIQKENIKIDHTEIENFESDHTEIEDIESDHTEKVNIEADHIQKENIKIDHTEIDNIESDHTEKVDIEADPIQEEKIEIYQTEIEDNESDHTEKVDIEADLIKKKTIEIDQTEIEDIKSDHIEKVDDEGGPIEEKEIDRDPSVNEIFKSVSDEEVDTDQSEKEMIVDHTVKEIEGMDVDRISKEVIPDHNDEGIKGGTEQELNETEVEEDRVPEVRKDDINNETVEDRREKVTENSPIEEADIMNCSKEEIGDIRPTEDKFDLKDMDIAEENSENLPDSDVMMNNDITNEKNSSIKMSEDNSHSNEQIDVIKNSYENIELVGEKQSEGTEKGGNQDQIEPCSQIELKEPEENNQTLEAMDCAEISTSYEEKNELGEVIDNAQLLDSDPYLQSENQDIIEDISPTGDVMPINVNSTQDSTSMEVD